jgi:hypothetical protein
MPITALDILKQSLVELEGPGYDICTDRVLAMFDRARTSLVPVKGRTPEQHTELTEACQAASIVLGKILKPKLEMTEEVAYVLLTKLGKETISKGDHRALLEDAIEQLERESAPVLVST